MKIAQLRHSTSADFENRKRALQRRETTEAYRKSAQYQSTKNPLLEALENLLSGKTEKELHRADEEARKLNAMEQTGVQASKDGSISESQLLTIEEVERPEREIRDMELTEKEVITHDLPVAASTSTQLSQVSGEITAANFEETVEDVEEQSPYKNVDVTADIPARFLNDFASRDARVQTVFGKELESLLSSHTFHKATAKYEQHVAMVNNGYRSVEEPVFSKIA